MMKFYINVLNSVWIVLILNFTKNVKAGQCSFEVERCGWGYIQTVNSFDWSVGDCNRLTHKITDNKVSCAHIGLGLEVVERRALLRLPLNLTSAVISFRFFINTGAGGIKMYLNTASYEEQYWSSYGNEYNKWIHLSLCFFGIRQPAWLIFEAKRTLTTEYDLNKLLVDDIAVEQAFDVHACYPFRTTTPFMAHIATDLSESTVGWKSTNTYTPRIRYISMTAVIFCSIICSFAYCRRRCKIFRKSSTPQQTGQTLLNTDSHTTQQLQSDITQSEPDGPPPTYPETCVLPSHGGQTVQVPYHTVSEPPPYDVVISAPWLYNVHT